jgi:hypothetical protein
MAFPFLEPEAREAKAVPGSDFGETGEIYSDYGLSGNNIPRFRIRSILFEFEKFVQQGGYAAVFVGFTDNPRPERQRCLNGKARSDDQVNRRPAMPYQVRQLHPTSGTTHVHVGEYDTNIVTAFENLDGLFGIRSFQRRIACIFYELDRVYADKTLVFHHQHNTARYNESQTMVASRGDGNGWSEGAHT